MKRHLKPSAPKKRERRRTPDPEKRPKQQLTRFIYDELED